ncbi:hypothetical protein [Gemmatirosa kalamazoonensis]|uniref:hypothetical protein n=1 Tax=Gemmatirosa kalamazoonensis TaxID=861299 RepID=UPI00046CC307|nr:hypothetical protein [Gemmatirosa kalamazoonensis]
MSARSTAPPTERTIDAMSLCFFSSPDAAASRSAVRTSRRASRAVRSRRKSAASAAERSARSSVTAGVVSTTSDTSGIGAGRRYAGHVSCARVDQPRRRTRDGIDASVVASLVASLVASVSASGAESSAIASAVSASSASTRCGTSAHSPSSPVSSDDARAIASRCP